MSLKLPTISWLPVIVNIPSIIVDPFAKLMRHIICMTMIHDAISMMLKVSEAIALNASLFLYYFLSS